jgi:uncharacterized membrane protein YbhN (UPF0104 family)
MRRLWVAAQAALLVVVAYFVARSVAHNWSQIRHADAALRLDPGALALAAAIIMATYALLIGAWRAVLAGWGERVPYAAAARIWTVSNLARYVPGRIWQIAGMAALAQQAGVKPWAAAGSAVIVQLLAIATGALVTGLLAAEQGNSWLIAGAGVACAAAAAALAWPRATRFLASLLGRLGRPFELAPVRAGPLLVSAAVTTVAWLAYGLALYFCALGLTDLRTPAGSPVLSLGHAVGAFTGAYLLGLIAVFTPGGLGVREGALLLLLSEPIGPAGATVVALGSRLLMTLTEVVAALVTLPLATTRTANATKA